MSFFIIGITWVNHHALVHEHRGDRPEPALPEPVGAIFIWSITNAERRHEPLPPRAGRHALVRFSFGAVVYLVAIVVAFVSAPATLILIAIDAVYYIFEQTPTGRLPDVGSWKPASATSPAPLEHVPANTKPDQ